MNQKPCNLYVFLRAVNGNWRNALFIQCNCAICPRAVSQFCQGYLLAADAEGKPLLVSVDAMRRLTGENLESVECREILDKQAFESAYGQYIEWHTDSAEECPLLQLGLIPDCQSQH